VSAPIVSAPVSNGPPTVRAAAPLPASVPPPISTSSCPPQKLSLLPYLRRHWQETRGSWFFPTLIGVLAVPGLSLLKPLIGFSGVAYAATGCMGLSVVCFTLYLFKRLGAYILGGERSVTDKSHSLLAPLARGGMLLGLCMLAPLAAAEYFIPPSGLLATVVPPLREVQRQLGIATVDAAWGDEDEDLLHVAGGTSSALEGAGAGADTAKPGNSLKGSENSQVVVAEG
jgi:hypothetical protein